MGGQGDLLQLQEAQVPSHTKEGCAWASMCASVCRYGRVYVLCYEPPQCVLSHNKHMLRGQPQVHRMLGMERDIRLDPMAHGNSK